MPTNPVRPKNFFIFVFSENRFSFLDRIEFLLFYALMSGSMAALFYFIWNLLLSETAMYGAGSLLLILVWAARIKKRFVEPYLEYRGIDKQAGIKRAKLVIEFNKATGRFSGQKSANRVIITATAAMILAGIYFGFAVIPEMGWPGSMFRGAVAFAILLMGLAYAAVRSLWKSIEADQIDELRGLRRIQLIICFVCLIVSILFCGILGYRYKEITGHAFFNGDAGDMEKIK